MSLSGNAFNKRRLIGFLLTLLILSISPYSTFAQDGPITHIVRQGETLTSIANRYHVSVNAIIAANHLQDADSLYIGERLVIPGTGARVAHATRQLTYQPGP